MKKRNLVFSLLSGVILALALPKPGWWFMSWFGLAPLVIGLKRSTAKQAVWLGFACGFVYFGMICRWLTIFGYLPWCLVAIKEAIWLAIFSASASYLLRYEMRARTYLVIAAVWTIIQWARTLGPFGFTWGSFAHTQANVLPIVQLGAITGPWGVEFLVCVTNIALAELVLEARQRENRKKIAKRVTLVGALIALSLVYGHTQLAKPISTGRDSFKVAIIQGSLTHDVNPKPEYVVEAYTIYDAMTRAAAIYEPDLIVWPETTIVDCITGETWGPLIAELARDTRSNMIVGGYDYSGDAAGRNYNAAHFFDRQGRKIGVYHKVHLVPYGEYVPLRKQMPWLKRYGIREVDILPGKMHVVVKTELGKVGTAICFESIFPGILSQSVRNGANFLVVLTNDAWFKHSDAAQQHLMMAQLRAAETHRYVVRAAATGISAIIDPHGRIRSELGIFRQGIVRGNVVSLNEKTPYVRYGDWFVYACFAGVAILVRMVKKGERKQFRRTYTC